MVSELDYLLLEHAVFSDDLDFAFGKCYSKGALRFLIVLILSGTKSINNNEDFLWRKYSHALSFQPCLFLDFSYGISMLNVKSWGGGGGENDMI